MGRYESAMKTLFAMQRNCDKAQHASESLEDKIKFSRMSRDLAKMYSDLRKMYYDYEDALKKAEKVEICEECGGMK